MHSRDALIPFAAGGEADGTDPTSERKREGERAHFTPIALPPSFPPSLWHEQQWGRGKSQNGKSPNRNLSEQKTGKSPNRKSPSSLRCNAGKSPSRKRPNRMSPSSLRCKIGRGPNRKESQQNEPQQSELQNRKVSQQERVPTE